MLLAGLWKIAITLVLLVINERRCDPRWLCAVNHDDDDSRDLLTRRLNVTCTVVLLVIAAVTIYWVS